jgi:protein TonB
MKTKPVNGKTETLEDIVFEGRNKTYGAYEMNQKRRKYMILAFLISITGVSTAVAIPFINSLRNPSDISREIGRGVNVTLAPIKEKSDVPPPPEPPKPELLTKEVIYRVPEIVEKAEDPEMVFSTDFMDRATVNPPVEIDIPVIDDNTKDIIDDPDEKEPMLFPSEPATFMGGDLNEFGKWVLQNVKFTDDAINAGVNGKVIIEFCVNSKGKVVDIKVMRNLYPDLDQETVRVINSSPVWTPAKQGGRPVKQKFVIPITFKVMS